MTLYQVDGQFINEIASSVFQVGEVFINETAEPNATQSLIFSQTAESSTKTPAASNTVTFAQTALELFLKTVAQSVVFSQTAEVNPSIKLTADNSLIFAQTAVSSLVTPFVTQSLIFNDIAQLVQVLELSESQSLIFSDAASPGFFNKQLFQTLIFSQVTGVGKIIAGGIEKNAGPQSLIFNHTVQKVLIKGAATSHSGSDSLVFNHNALLPREFSIPQSFILSDTALAETVKNVEQDLIFSHSVVRNLEIGLTPTHTAIFNHAMAFINRIDLCRYTPSIGANSDPNAPTPPPSTMSFSKTGAVTLSHPTTSPTLSVSIRAPEFGDVHRFNAERINRETRGGSLQVFVDPDWPQVETLVLQFSVLKEAEAQAVLDFFKETLGLEVKLEDWNGRTWHGFVISPESPLVRNRRDVVDLSFEFEGEQQ